MAPLYYQRVKAQRQIERGRGREGIRERERDRVSDREGKRERARERERERKKKERANLSMAMLPDPQKQLRSCSKSWVQNCEKRSVKKCWATEQGLKFLEEDKRATTNVQNGLVFFFLCSKKT